MKNLLSAFALLLACLPAWPQEADASAPQRERIKAQRTQVESAYRNDEKACYGKFAVNDCLNAAKARRRQALAELRREEIALNDAERRRKAAERLRILDNRSAAEPSAPQAHARTRTAGDPAQREAKAAARSAQRAASAPARAPEQAQRKSAPLDDTEVARNRQRHEERLARAQERRAEVEKKLAERKKPSAKPLPTPAP